jgi:hypothetical protein
MTRDLLTPCPGRDSNSQETYVSGDFESFPTQSEASAPRSVGQSAEGSQSLTESQVAAAPVCYTPSRTPGHRVGDER